MRERSLAVGTLPNHLPVTRLGLRVKRGLAGAVTRNRAKRMLRAAYRQLKRRLSPGWDVVAVLTRADGLSTERLERELLSACANLKLLTTPRPIS